MFPIRILEHGLTSTELLCGSNGNFDFFGLWLKIVIFVFWFNLLFILVLKVQSSHELSLLVICLIMIVDL